MEKNIRQELYQHLCEALPLLNIAERLKEDELHSSVLAALDGWNKYQSYIDIHYHLFTDDQGTIFIELNKAIERAKKLTSYFSDRISRFKKIKEEHPNPIEAQMLFNGLDSTSDKYRGYIDAYARLINDAEALKKKLIFYHPKNGLVQYFNQSEFDKYGDKLLSSLSENYARSGPSEISYMLFALGELKLVDIVSIQKNKTELHRVLTANLLLRFTASGLAKQLNHLNKGQLADEKKIRNHVNKILSSIGKSD